MNPHVLLSIPTYDNLVRAKHLHMVRTASNQFPVSIQTGSHSVLTKNFNFLWANALNQRKVCTHFLMLHADITPEEGFIDKMMKTMENLEADVLSVVSPIKSSEGLTSTAIDIDGIWNVKRLTMKEIFDRDPTFTDEKLLINTGLMLVNMQKPWVEKICFRFEDAIIVEDEKFKAVGMSEDWLFSRDAKALGAKIFATREISILHHGNAAYPNNSVWGTQIEGR